MRIRVLAREEYIDSGSRLFSWRITRLVWNRPGLWLPALRAVRLVSQHWNNAQPLAMALDTRSNTVDLGYKGTSNVGFCVRLFSRMTLMGWTDIYGTMPDYEIVTIAQVSKVLESLFMVS